MFPVFFVSSHYHFWRDLGNKTCKNCQQKIKGYIYCIRNTEMEKCSAICYSSSLYTEKTNSLFLLVLWHPKYYILFLIFTIPSITNAHLKK